MVHNILINFCKAKGFVFVLFGLKTPPEMVSKLSYMLSVIIL